MKTVVIGLGSMGKRRIRLIREMYPKCNIVGIDGREDRRVEAALLFNINCASSISEIEGDIYCAFVCTPPLSHAAIICDCLNRGWHVFTEINLVDDGYDENMRLAQEKGCVLFLSSTFLFREEIKYIRSQITSDKRWNYLYHTGQYLPDWHPWENYKDYFVGDKRTNGCREILAIELPWIISTFGEIKDVKAVSDKITSLSIDYADNFFIQLEHKNGNKGMLAVDVVSPVAVRRMEVFTEGDYIFWGGTPESLAVFDKEKKKLTSVKLTEQTEHAEGYCETIVENAYRNEINTFFDVLINGHKPIYGFEDDMKVLSIIDSIGA